MKLSKLMALVLAGLFALSFISLPPVANAAITGAYPDTITQITCTSGTTCAIALSSLTYGDILMVTASQYGGSTPTLTVSDGVSTWYTPAATNDGATAAATFYAYITASTGATDTVTVSTTQTITQMLVVVYMVSGLFTDYSVEQSTATGTSSSPLAGSMSFTGAYTEACVAAGAIASSYITGATPSSYTKYGSGYTGSAYSISTSSPTDPGFTASGSAVWSAAGECLSRVHISPANVYLLNSNYITAPQIDFNINQYKGSYVEAQYPNSAPAYYPSAPAVNAPGLTVPEVEASTSGSNLLTVWVGNSMSATGTSYYRTLIPCTATGTMCPVVNNTFYLQAPSQVSAFTVAVQDLSGTYSQGSQIYLQLGKTIYASGYLDASNDFQVWLPQGYYNVTLIQGTSTYKTYISLPPSSGSTVTIQILKLSVSGNCQGCTTGWVAGFDSALQNIIFKFSDTADSTYSINDSVFVANSTFPTGRRVYTHLWTGTCPSSCFGTLTDTIPCDNGNCNSTLAAGITVRIIYSDTYNTFTQYVPVTNTGLFASIPNIPNSLLGWSSLAGTGPGAPSLLGVMAYFVILISTSVFGAYSAKFGVIPAAGLTAVFTYAGWLNLTAGAATFLIAMAVTSFIAYLQHGR